MHRHYCRTCGAEVLNKEVCNNCGCQPDKGNAYCYHCGGPTMPHAIICVKCGAGLRKRYSTILLSLTIIGLLAALTVTGFYIYQAGRNSVPTTIDYSHQNYKKIADSPLIVKEEARTSINPTISNPVKIPANPVHKKDSVNKKLVLNLLTPNEIRQYPNACLFSAKNGKKNSVILIDNKNSGEIRINRNLYTVQLQSRDSTKGIVLFTGDPYNIKLTTEHLNKVSGGWDGVGTITVTDKITGAEIHHKIYSSCFH